MKPVTSKARRRRRTRALAISASLALASADDCPPMLSGWIPAAGCQKYYLCEAGKKVSPDYDCREGFLFDESTTNCQQAAGVLCKTLTGDQDETAEHQAQAPPSDRSPCDGVPEHFFVDIPSQSCPSSCQKNKPEWINAIFPSREECCKANFSWMPIDECMSKEPDGDDKPDMWTVAPTIQEDTDAPVATPTRPPVEISPDDPKFLFMCGVDWGDASSRCHQRCASGEDDECPPGEGCFSETSCINGVIKDTTAPTEPPNINGVIKDTPAPTEPPVSRTPTPKPTRRTRKPVTDAPTKSPVLAYITHKPTSLATEGTPNSTLSAMSPVLAYITHKPTSLATEGTPNSTFSAMSAVHSINVVGSFVDDDQNENYNSTSIPSYSSTNNSTEEVLQATRKPRPDTLNPTFQPSTEPTESTSMESFPTFAPSSAVTGKPNYVVTMIATPEVANTIESMSESVQGSHFNPAYGYGMVSKLGTSDQHSSNGLQDSGYLNVYNQESAAATPATEAPPLSLEQAFFDTSYSSVSELIIPVSADATVSPKRPDVNFGLNSMLALDGANAFEQFDILLKFDVSIIEKSSKIKSATLRMYAADDCPFGGAYYSTTSFNSDWDASQVTWNTAPRSLALLDSLGGVKADNWYSIDVMSLFNLKISTYVTIRVESRTMGRCMFASMEHRSSNNDAPYMVLDVEGESQLAGMSVSIKENSPAAPIQNEFFRVESGEFVMVRASADATIDAIRVNENLGGMPSLHLSLNTQSRQVFDSLIHFDLSEFRQHKPKSAMLVLFPEIKCHSAGRIAVTGSNRQWADDEMTWTSAPESQLTIGTFGAIDAGHWYGFNVLKALEWAHDRMMDSITFRLSSDGDYSCQYSSRQSGRAPKLIASF